MAIAALSIHPRNWPDGDKRKLNTCEPRSVARLQRALAGIERHIERNPNDANARQRADNLKHRIAAS